MEYPTLLENLPAPHLEAYPVYTVIAEKLEAAVRLGMANSRMKDFYDLRMFARRTDIDAALVKKAIRATFRRRKTTHSSQTPLAFSADFAGDTTKQRQWVAFLKKNHLGSGDGDSLQGAINVIWAKFGQHVVETAE